jgi:hypothetical protein
MAALEAQLDTVDAELRRFARADERCRALQSPPTWRSTAPPARDATRPWRD